MNAVTAVDVSKAIDNLGNTAKRIKAERDELVDVLRDIRMGADMMLQPALNLTGSFLGYVKEVRRVADEALKAVA